MTTNIEIKESLDEFKKEMNKVLVGDYDMNNGYKGIIHELRDIKQTMDESPSFLKLFKDRPGVLVGCIVGALTVWLLLYTLVSVPQVHGWLLELFGIPVL